MVSRTAARAALFYILLLGGELVASSQNFFLPPHGLGGHLSITIGGNGNTNSKVQGVVDPNVAACLKMVAENDEGMKAINWMLFTTYACAASNEAGCKALLAAGRVPFDSQADVLKALQAAAASVKACVANKGRALKAWGADIVYDNPAVVVATLDNICNNAAKYAKSGQTLPELDDFGLLDTFAAVATGISQAYLAFYLGFRTGSPAASIGTNAGIGMVFAKLFYQQNEADCRELYSEQGCAELGSDVTAGQQDPAGTAGSRLGTSSYKASSAVLAWGKSDACRACAKNLETVCLNHAADYNKKFKMVATMSNAVGLIGSAWARLGIKAASAAAEADFTKDVVMAGIVTPLWQSWRFGQAANGQPDWLKDTSLESFKTAAETAEKWRNRHSVPTGSKQGGPSPAEFKQGGPSGATNQARAACTNMVTPNDGCLSGERVWCCAGVKSTRQLQGPCTFLGPPGTTRACPASGTPMRYCCPLWQNPGEASAPTAPASTQKAPTSTYKVGSSAYELCPCKPPCNAPVGGGWGVRMAYTNDCVNCFNSYPCPTGMKCTPGTPSPAQAPSDTFATCV